MTRRTLAFIDYYPTPAELYQRILTSGWAYKSDRPFYATRDRALCAVLYLAALRISEALRLTREQFTREPQQLTIRGILLSKRRKGKTAFRPEAFLTLTGKRRNLSLLVLDYLTVLDKLERTRLFPFGRKRAWQIVSATLGIPQHWLRAYGENFLYDEWGGDLLAVAEYVAVSTRTLPKYIRGSWKKHPVV